MATITDLDEPFEGTATAELTTSNCKADSLTGGTSAASYFTSDSFVGSTAAEININGTYRILRFNFTAEALVHFDIYVDVETPPSSNSVIINWYDGDTLKVGDVQMVYITATTFQFRLREGSSARWTSSVLPVGQYRLAIKIEPASATGHSLNIYSGANIDTTPVETSGNWSASVPGATTIDNIRIGVMSNVTAKLRYDGMTADDADPIVRDTPASVTSLAWKVRVGGSWVTPVAKTRVGGAWV